MTEQNTEQYVDDRIFENLKYIGKEYVKDNTDKNGNKYKMYKVLFDIGGQYPRKMNCRNTVKLQDGLTFKDLEESETYNIGYTEHEYYNETLGKDIKSRWIVFIGNAKKNVKVTTIGSKYDVLNNEKIGEYTKAFKDKYASNSDSMPSELHFIGGYIVSVGVNKSLIEQLKTAYNSILQDNNENEENELIM